MSAIRQSIERVANAFFNSPAGPLCFETVSLLGRLTTRKLHLAPEEENFLNLGCGWIYADGLINVDFFWTRSRKDYKADLRYPLKIDSETAAGVVCDHALEHFAYADATKLLQECWRVLKPGGTIRIVVPDLSLFLLSYAKGDTAWFRKWEDLMFTNSRVEARTHRRLTTPLEAVSFITQEYGHRSCWDVPLLTAYLEKAGFVDVTPTEYRTGRCEQLLIDSDDVGRRFVSLYVEGTKPAKVFETSRSSARGDD